MAWSEWELGTVKKCRKELGTMASLQLAPDDGIRT